MTYHNTKGIVYAEDFDHAFTYQAMDSSPNTGHFKFRLMRIDNVWRMKVWMNVGDLFPMGKLPQSTYQNFPVNTLPKPMQHFLSKLGTTTYNAGFLGQMPHLTDGGHIDFGISSNGIDFYYPSTINTSQYIMFDQTFIRTPDEQPSALPFKPLQP